jgi:hypothetical protein
MVIKFIHSVPIQLCHLHKPWFSIPLSCSFVVIIIIISSIAVYKSINYDIRDISDVLSIKYSTRTETDN